MLPLFQPNDEVLVDLYAYQKLAPLVGEVVILQHPRQEHLHIIKRVTQINKSGYFFVQGDNSSVSNDSRSFGWVKPKLILGKVVCFF